MTVEKTMSAKVVSVKSSDNLVNAVRIMKENKIKHLPVVDDNGKLVGIVTDRDLKEASASDATTLEVHELLYLLDKVKIESIMTRNVVTIDKSPSNKQAAMLMVEKDIGCLPVLDGDNVVGIITRTDLLRAFAGLAD